ncbi:MAG: tetratricopeptide repeat protein [Planctomycetota bacterium]|nr:tetratricopeptide repeat protein [Planctomycetota bacterium]
MKRAILASFAVFICVSVVSGCGGPGTRQLVTRGVSQFQTGRLDEAEATLKRALAVSPSDPDALFYMGRVYHVSGFYEQAVYYYQCCLDAVPGYPGLAEYLAQAQRQAGPAGTKLRFIPDLTGE